MDKMRFESPDVTAANIDKIAAMFPGVVTEGKVNFDLLRSLLGDEVYGDEAYEFTWAGKKAAIAEVGRPIRKTLRPCVEESKNWDTTENLYIEGNNLDVLKLLQESYLGKVKMIYIDPPYNTGNDFIYRDNFTRDKDEYDEEVGVYDENGDRLFRNSESNGRFHSDWCSMIYPRLVLARNILRDNGVIFISINDAELFNLLKLCNEVFGESNFIATFVWSSKKGGGSDNNLVVTDQEYVIAYKKSDNSDLYLTKIEIDAEPLDREDEHGKYRRGRELNKWGANSRREDRPTMFFPIPGPNGEDVYPIRNDGVEGCWRWGKKNMLEAAAQGNIEFVMRENGTYIAYEKVRTEENRLKPYRTLLEGIGATADGSKQIKGLFDDKKVFDFPKPIDLLKTFISMGLTSTNDIILDFFSGSATTAHAVMQLNAEDGGKRKFIMVQLPEPCAPDSEAANAGYKNICEIGKERIRRAGEKIMEEAGLTAQNLDIGFRVLKLDDTNMKNVYYAAGEYTQDLLAGMEDNIKDDRTGMDLLYACLLDWGLPLSMPHTQEKIDGFTVHTYNDSDLIVCFDKHISDAVVKEIARHQPLRAVFRDNSFAGSPEKINVEEIFKLLAPNTSVRVI